MKGLRTKFRRILEYYGKVVRNIKNYRKIWRPYKQFWRDFRQTQIKFLKLPENIFNIFLILTPRNLNLL